MSRGRPCNICNSRHRADVERAVLLGDEPIRAVARRFDLKEAGLRRHLQKHARLLLAGASNSSLPAADVLDDAAAQNGAYRPMTDKELATWKSEEAMIGAHRNLWARLEGIATTAEQSGTATAATSAISEMRRLLETRAKWSGIVPEPVANVNVGVQVIVGDLRDEVLAEIRRDGSPDTRAAVAAKLLEPAE